MKRERRRARSLALQALYEIDSVGHPEEEVIARYGGDLSPEAREFMIQIVHGTLESESEIDVLLEESAPGMADQRACGYRSQHFTPIYLGAPHLGRNPAEGCDQ